MRETKKMVWWFIASRRTGNAIVAPGVKKRYRSFEEIAECYKSLDEERQAKTWIMLVEEKHHFRDGACVRKETIETPILEWSYV